ncbi:MAG: hypothetical protein AAGA96_12055 [Verrucomicrobiota bacterium]
MTTKLEQPSAWIRAVVAIGIAVVCSGASIAEAQESVEMRELKAALERSQSQLADLRRVVAESEFQRKALVEALAEAVRVSEEQVAIARETQLKLQAFGVDLFTQDENSLEQRLLKAVRDLDIAQQDLERQDEAIHGLTESLLKVLQAMPEADAKVRNEALEAVEKARIAMNHSGKNVEGEVGDLSDSSVVSIDSEIGLIVLDAGREEGLRVGTPITVLRQDRPIYTALIIEVREAIAGAVLQDRLADATEVVLGDSIRLQPNHTF